MYVCMYVGGWLWMMCEGGELKGGGVKDVFTHGMGVWAGESGR